MASSDKDPRPDFLDFDPPSLEFIENIAGPMRKYFTPEFFGFDNLDKDKPALYVTNHSVFGVTDGVLFGAKAYKENGIFFRSLVDDMHYKIPYWKDVNPQLGFVKGTRENCSALMKAGEHIIVYPGGGRETMKLKGEKYKLTWKNRLGFVRMAIMHGYDIIPVTQVGGDDAYDIIADKNDIMNSTLGKYLKDTDFVKETLKNGEYIPPIGKGLLFTPFPKPVKLYWKVGERIETKHYNKRHDKDENLWELRNQVELAMDKMFIELLEYRKNDPSIGFFRKFINSI